MRNIQARNRDTDKDLRVHRCSWRKSEYGRQHLGTTLCGLPVYGRTPRHRGEDSLSKKPVTCKKCLAILEKQGRVEDEV